MSKAILSVLGRDRPGIVAAVSRALCEQSCNIENVSQTMLQNEFAGIFIVSMPNGMGAGELHRGLEARLLPLALTVLTKPCEAGEEACTAKACEPFVITTRGPDRKGLVADISEVIARHGVNITRLQAVFKGGEDPGDNIMIYEVDVPKSVDAQALAADLRDRAAALRLDLIFQHRNIFEALHRI
ncbi:MAG: ACT domain-containing protein [Desulfobacterales bacterium]|jgi:glycine cleavage system transcriptional repressor|nr:ACT domain-containing protein [Desulfobacterales bacterium]